MEGIRIIKEEVIDNVWCVKFATPMKVFDLLSSGRRSAICYNGMANMCTNLDKDEYEFTIPKNIFNSLLIGSDGNTLIRFSKGEMASMPLLRAGKIIKAAEVAKYLEGDQIVWSSDETENAIRAEREELHRSIGLPYAVGDLRMQPSLSTQAFLEELRITEQQILNSYGVPNCLIQSESINNNQNKLSMENLKLQRGYTLTQQIENAKSSIQRLNVIVNGAPGYSCDGKGSNKIVTVESHDINVVARTSNGRSEQITFNSEESPEISAAWANVIKAKTDLLIKQLQDLEEEFKAL